MALGIVSANKYIPIFPSLPQALKVGFSFCPGICLAENNLPVGYTFREGWFSSSPTTGLWQKIQWIRVRN
jgi:hypothetical protein